MIRSKVRSATPTVDSSVPALSVWSRALGLGLGYLLLALLAYQLNNSPHYSVPLWPAAGLALAGLAVWGWHYWPALWLGAFAAKLLAQLLLAGLQITSTELALAALTASGVSLQALLGMRLTLRFLKQSEPLSREREVLAFLLLAGPLACLVSATVGVVSLHFLKGLSTAALVADWPTWWVGDSFGVLLLAPLFLLVLPGSRQHWRGQAWSIAAPLLLVGALLMVGYSWLLGAEQAQQRQQLSHSASKLQTRLETLLYQRRERLRAIEGLFEAKAHVTQTEFARFNRLAAARTGVEIIEWAPRVTQAEVATLGQNAGRDGVANFALLESDAQGHLVPAKPRPDYYPLWFLSEQAEHLPPGYDLGAEVSNRAAMALAAATTRPALVLRQTGQQSSGNWRLLVPIYQPGFNAQSETEAARAAALRGFAVAVIDPAQLWAEVIEQAVPEGLVFKVTALADWNHAALLHFAEVTPEREAQPDWVGQIDGLAGPGLLVQVWSRSPWLPAQSRAVQMYWASALLLTLITSIYVFGSAGQRRRMAHEMELRRASQDQLYTLIDNMQVGIIIYDRQRVICSVNSAVQTLMQMPTSEMLGKQASDLGWHFLREDGSPLTIEDYAVSEVLRQGHAAPGRLQGLLLAGWRRPAWLMVSATPLLDAQRQISQVVVTFMDITEQRRLEQREQGRARVLSALGSEAALPDILQGITQLVENEDAQARCSILLLDAAGQHLLLGAAPSLPDFYNQAVHGLAIGDGVGSCGTAAFTGQRVIVTDIDSHPHWADFRALAQRADLRSCWSEPILGSNAQVLGTFAMYHREVCAPDADDIALITTAADLARLAIERHRAQAQLHQLNAELEQRVQTRTAELTASNLRLSDSSTRFGAILNTLVDGVLTIDEQGTVESINPAAERLFGYRAEQIIGCNVKMLMPEPYQSEHDGYLAHYRSTGQARIIGIGREVQGRRQDGSLFMLELAVSEIHLADRRLFAGVVHDVTERKAGERAARHLQDALQAIPEGFAIYGPDDRLLLCNQPYLDLYRLGTPQEMIGQSFEDILRIGLARGDYQAALGREAAWLAERLAAHQHPGPVIEQALPDGRWLRISETRLSDGSIAGLRSDITELKRAQTVAESARREAEAANLAKSEFLAVMSHEIRTPMNGVVGMVDVLQQSSLQGEQIEMVDIIRDSALSLLGIIEDILDFSKIEAGKLEIEQLPVAVAEVVEQTCAMLTPLANRKKVALTLFTDPALPTLVLGDAQRLRQIILNLANNAIKFSAGLERTGCVSVRALLEQRQGQQVVIEIEVRDNGIGMDQPTQARLFSSFTQADASTTRRFGGTGLGLVIARNLAQLMGGDIAVQSQSGVGSCFTLHLPALALAETAPQRPQALASQLNAPDAQHRASLAPPSRAQALAQQQLILVAEDNPTNQKVIVRQLALLGYAADVADDGAAALDLWQSGDYALLLTDLHMPRMDGYQLTSAIRSQEAGARHVPVVALTANALKGEALRCLEIGMDDYLTKPTPLTELRTVLQKWLPVAGPAPELLQAQCEPSPVRPEPPVLSSAQGLTALPTLDTRVLAALVGDDPATLKEFLQEFAESAQAIATDLLSACAVVDAAQVRALAHKLKSSARSVGALALGELCAELEAAGKAGQTQALSELAERFHSELKAVQARLAAPSP